MSIEKSNHSSNKAHKFMRNLAIASSLFAVMNTTQSCKDKNAGMPVHADAIEFSQNDDTNTTSEYLKINDNKVKFHYTFDMDENADWNQKDIQYELEVNRGKDNKITATLKGSTYYGSPSDEGVVPENKNDLNRVVEYASLKEFNEKFPDEIVNYINSQMDNLQNNNQIYAANPDNISINQDANNEVEKKASQLVGYLKYKMNAHELSVVKQGDEVVLPITRNGNRFDFVIKENTTGIQLQGKDKKVSKMYDITMKQGDKMTTLTTALSKDDLKFAEELTKSFEKLLKVGDIAQEIEDEAFLGKGLEAKQLLDKN